MLIDNYKPSSIQQHENHFHTKMHSWDVVSTNSTVCLCHLDGLLRP